MFDINLSEMFDVKTRTLKQAVRWNIDRFPSDFLKKHSVKEWKELNTIWDNLPETAKYSPAAPFAFTKQDIALISSVINCDKAILFNNAVMRAFVFLWQYSLTYKDLTEKLEELEKTYDMRFQDIYAVINYLMEKDKGKRELRIESELD